MGSPPSYRTQERISFCGNNNTMVEKNSMSLPSTKQDTRFQYNLWCGVRTSECWLLVLRERPPGVYPLIFDQKRYSRPCSSRAERLFPVFSERTALSNQQPTTVSAETGQPQSSKSYNAPRVHRLYSNRHSSALTERRLC